MFTVLPGRYADNSPTAAFTIAQTSYSLTLQQSSGLRLLCGQNSRNFGTHSSAGTLLRPLAQLRKDWQNSTPSTFPQIKTIDLESRKRVFQKESVVEKLAGVRVSRARIWRSAKLAVVLGKRSTH